MSILSIVGVSISIHWLSSNVFIPLVFDQFIGIGSGSIRFIIDRVDRINNECIAQFS